MDNSALPVKQASAQSFAAYGTFVAASEGAPFEGGSAAAYKEKVGVLDTGGRTSVGVLNLKARESEFHELERHVATPELLVMVKGDVVFPVAPANQPESAPDAAALEAFRVNQGEAVIMRPGVWHGLPFPLQAEATVLVIFKEGTPDQDFQLNDLGIARRCAW
jgi:ureidoglycolate lyase